NNPSNPRSIFGANTANVRGNDLNRIPEWKTTLWGNYTWTLTNGSSLNFYATWSWTDEMFYSPFNLDIDKSPDFNRLDLRAGWTSADRTYSITGWVNNVTDEIAIRNLNLSAEGDNWSRTATASTQRRWGIDFRYKF
ncbi:MAG: hypothetical protein AAF512_17355, partial [Pseudomonadota bacterium]